MRNSLSNIKKCRYYLNRNECIGIPTETVYGLAANAYSHQAVSKIFKLKKRIKKKSSYCTLCKFEGFKSRLLPI